MGDEKSKLPSALQKTTFTVLGICCGSEAALIYKILNPTQGVENVSVNVLAKTVTVVHDPTQVPASHIVNALNKAKLNAGIREHGQIETGVQSWPSASVWASGMLMIVSMFSCNYKPLSWVALASIAVGILGRLQRSIAALARCSYDINVLMVIAVFGAIGLGCFVEGASIVFLFRLTEWLEQRSSAKARASLESLMDLAPRTAVIAETGKTVAVKDVGINTVVLVKAGECVPVDGVVVGGGGSTINESILTGEFMPVDKDIGSRVWAGTQVLTGFIDVMTTAFEENSAIARMAKLVEDAQNQRWHEEGLVEALAKYYVPGVIVVAACLALIPWALGAPDFRQWIDQSLVLLVISCPCAFVMSIPLGNVCVRSAAAKMGMLVKGGTDFEVLEKVKAIAFDKTGTLTEGSFKVLDFQIANPQLDVNKILYWISSLEILSGHPMAKALVEYAMLLGVQPSREVKDFKMIPGEGISGFVEDHFIQIGNAQLASRNGWPTENRQGYLSETGATVGYVGVDDIFVGYFCVGDRTRGEVSEAFRELKKQGIQVFILSGDSRVAAEVGENIEVEASLAPEKKMRRIRKIRQKWGYTAMVGDGINDTPAFAAADVGIAMGVTGSAVATEIADMALMSTDLRKIPEAIKLAKTMSRAIDWNICLATWVKLLPLVILTLGGKPYLWGAIMVEMATCLVVILASTHLPHEHQRGAQELPITNRPLSLSPEQVKGPEDDSKGLRLPLLSSEKTEERIEQVETKRSKRCCG